MIVKISYKSISDKKVGCVTSTFAQSKLFGCRWMASFEIMILSCHAQFTSSARGDIFYDLTTHLNSFVAHRDFALIDIEFKNIQKFQSNELAARQFKGRKGGDFSIWPLRWKFSLVGGKLRLNWLNYWKLQRKFCRASKNPLSVGQNNLNSK